VRFGGLTVCSCPTYRKEKELCVHILWVLIKKLRLPRANPLVFQLALVEREVLQLIKGQVSPGKATKGGGGGVGGGGAGPAEVAAKPIVVGDVCPVCTWQCHGLADFGTLLCVARLVGLVMLLIIISLFWGCPDSITILCYVTRGLI
jgi:hypothetical protein